MEGKIPQESRMFFLETSHLTHDSLRFDWFVKRIPWFAYSCFVKNDYSLEV